MTSLVVLDELDEMSVEVLELETTEEDLLDTTVVLTEGMTGFDEGITGLAELLVILLEIETLLEVETLLELKILLEVETGLIEDLVEDVLFDEEVILVEEVFLVEEVAGFLVDDDEVFLPELVTRAGVAVTALQTWETTGAESPAKGLFGRLGALNQNLQNGRGSATALRRASKFGTLLLPVGVAIAFVVVFPRSEGVALMHLQTLLMSVVVTPSMGLEKM